MSRVVRFALWLLVALWLPATMHCQLEAAGLGESHQDSCCAGDTGADCLGDACANIEASLIKDSAPELYLAAPASVCHFCRAALVSAAHADPLLSPERHAPPLELKVAWQFIERAAPPVRAPSLNA